MLGVLYATLMIGGVGLVLAVILSLASKFMAVPTDEKVEKVRACLPGANCGACGFSGCDGYAAAVVEGSAEPNLCTAGGADTARQLSELLGKDINVEKKYAFIKCNHGIDRATREFSYNGSLSCAAANLMYRGPLACKYGCLGLGECVNVCQYAAIKIQDGIAVVDKALCVGCGKCAAVCPKGIIEIIPEKAAYMVACSNTQKGAVARKVCTATCIGCGKCAKICAQEAIKISNNLGYIDINKCIGCGECEAACPTKCIIKA